MKKALVTGMLSELEEKVNILNDLGELNNVKIQVTGIFNDANVYQAVSNAISYGEVGFSKYNGIKKGVTFKISSDLKTYARHKEEQFA